MSLLLPWVHNEFMEFDIGWAETCASSLRVDEALSIWQTTVTTGKNLQEKLGDSGVSISENFIFLNLLDVARTNHPFDENATRISAHLFPSVAWTPTEVFRFFELQGWRSIQNYNLAGSIPASWKSTDGSWWRCWTRSQTVDVPRSKCKMMKMQHTHFW